MNCGVPGAGRYCSACGQPALSGRLTIGRVCRRLVANAFDLERGLLHTFWALLRGPGAVARDYILGRTVDYANPVKYFIIAVTLAQLVALRVGAVDEFVGGLLAGFGAVREGLPPFARPQFVEFLSGYVIALAAPAVILMAAFTRLLFRLAGRNYAENLVSGLFVNAQFFFALALLMPLLNARKSAAMPALFMMIITRGRRRDSSIHGERLPPSAPSSPSRSRPPPTQV